MLKLHRRFAAPCLHGIRACGQTRECPVAEAKEQADLESQSEAQRRLLQASAGAMSLQYCRDHGRYALTRALRSITIDMSFTFRHWRKHQRAIRHLQLWTPQKITHSDNIRRLLFPDLAVIAATSCLVCEYNTHTETFAWLSQSLPFDLPSMLHLPVEAFSLTSVALGLMVTFKTQTGYARFIEARNLWGLLINESRAFSSRIMARVPAQSGKMNQEVLDAKTYALKLIRSFPITLKYHLTEDGCNPHIHIKASTTDAELKKATTAALRSELKHVWNHQEIPRERDFVDRLLEGDVANKPLYVLHELQHTSATIFAAAEKGGLDPVAATEMDRSLTTYQNVLGACEKILRTPIYTPYTRFTSRFLYMWCNSLPLAMYPLCGPLLTPWVTLTSSFFMLGIEDIGARVEQPFNVLPLWQYQMVIEASALQIMRHSDSLDHSEMTAQESDLEEFEWDEENLGSYVDPLSQQNQKL